MQFRLIGPLLLAVIASGQTITNFAGNGTPGYQGDAGPATQAEVYRVVGLATDASGNIYLADQNNNVVRKVDTNGIITTFAGTGVPGFTGDGGPATQAQMNGPLGVCVAPSGVIYVNDQGNHRVRAIATTGTITTVAGSGSTLSFGDGGPATSAGMMIPIRCAVDPSGNLYIADQGAHVIRKVDINGIISTFAGVSGAPGFSGDGAPATQALMNNPTAVSVDAAGNLYVTDQFNHRIRKIDSNGIIATVAGNGSNIFAGDGGAATSASLNYPGETVIDSAGSLFIVDTVNQVIRKVTGGIISTVAGTPGTTGSTGDGGSPLQAKFNQPFAITLDSGGNLYVSDVSNNRVRKISGVAAVPSACTYTLSSGGQAFAAAGGSGSVDVMTGVGCVWSTPNIPSWITTTGFPVSGSGTVSFQVAANGGAGRSVTLVSSGVSFTIEQQAASIAGLNFIGSMPHIAAEENWTTAFTLVNKGAASAQARLSFFGDAVDPTGNGPLMLPLAFPQQSAASGPLLAASLDRTLPVNSSLTVDSAGAQVPPVLVGSAQLAATGAVDGFAIFHLIPGSQEAVVPMETRKASSYLLAFDNTGGVVLGVAIQNVSAQNGNIGIVIRDGAGTVIGSGTSISLAGHGHTSFVLSDQYPVTAGIIGTIEFDTPAGGQISVLGIRTTPLGNSKTLTTIPALANVETQGGSIAHIATGNGWQTTFVLVNTGTAAANVNLNFFADGTGLPLQLPISFPQAGSGATTAMPSVSQTLAAGATLLVESVASPLNPTPTTGSAQLTTSGHVGGFVIFRYNPNGQEAVVPLESRTTSALILAFDNTSSTATGIAINSVSAQPASVPVVVRNDAGLEIATDTLNLAANGHLAFTLATDKYPTTANTRGTIEFDTPPGGKIGALGIRIPVAHTFTTLPALAK